MAVDEGARAGQRSLAPAVDVAARILSLLSQSQRESTLSEIARDLKVSKSSCFNVLSVLLEHQLVSKDPRFRTYRLGPKLIELGASSRRGFSRRHLFRDALQPIVDESGVGCVVGQPLNNLSGVIIIDRIISLGGEKNVAPPVGQFVSLTGPAIGRAMLARYENEEVIDLLQTHQSLKPTAIPAFLAQLDHIRAAGYGTSLEEAHPNTNAVAACVMNRDYEVAAVVCLVGSTEALPGSSLPKWGERLKQVAAAIEASLDVSAAVAAS